MPLYLTKRNYLFIGSLFIVLQAFIVAQLPASQLVFDVSRNLAITGAIAMIMTFLYALIMAANREASFKEAFFYLGVLVILILVLMYIYVKKWQDFGKPPVTASIHMSGPAARANDHYLLDCRVIAQQ